METRIILKDIMLLSDGTVKLVSKVPIPANPNSTKSQLTSLLTTPTQNKTFIGTRRIYMTKCKLFTLIFERGDHT